MQIGEPIFIGRGYANSVFPLGIFYIFFIESAWWLSKLWLVGLISDMIAKLEKDWCSMTLADTCCKIVCFVGVVGQTMCGRQG